MVQAEKNHLEALDQEIAGTAACTISLEGQKASQTADIIIVQQENSERSITQTGDMLMTIIASRGGIGDAYIKVKEGGEDSGWRAMDMTEAINNDLVVTNSPVEPTGILTHLWGSYGLRDGMSQESWETVLTPCIRTEVDGGYRIDAELTFGAMYSVLSSIYPDYGVYDFEPSKNKVTFQLTKDLYVKSFSVEYNGKAKLHDGEREWKFSFIIKENYTVSRPHKTEIKGPYDQ